MKLSSLENVKDMIPMVSPYMYYTHCVDDKVTSCTLPGIGSCQICQVDYHNFDKSSIVSYYSRSKNLPFRRWMLRMQDPKTDSLLTVTLGKVIFAHFQAINRKKPLRVKTDDGLLNLTETFSKHLTEFNVSGIILPEDPQTWCGDEIRLLDTLDWRIDQ